MLESITIPQLPQVTGMDIRYEVHLRSNGKQCGWPDGTWFMTSGLMRNFATKAEADAGIIEFLQSNRGTQYAHLPMRIVQIVTIGTVIQEVE